MEKFSKPEKQNQKIEKILTTNHRILEELIKNSKNALNVSWFGKPYKLIEKDILYKEESYVISPVDYSDKYSTGFDVCTGLIVVGKEKDTGKNKSILTHQEPYSIYKEESMARKKFIENLEDRLKVLEKECEKETLEAIIIGGLDVGHDYIKNNNKLSNGDKYFNSLEIINEEVKKILNIRPVIINGPKKATFMPDSVFFDTQKRKLYFIRSNINEDMGDFSVS